MTVREEIGALSVALALGGVLFAIQQADRSPSTVHSTPVAERASASFDDAAPAGAPTPAPQPARRVARRHHRPGFGRPTPFTRPKPTPRVVVHAAPVIRAAPVRPVVVAPVVQHSAPVVRRPAPVVRRPAPVARRPAPRPAPKPRPRPQRHPASSGEPFVLSG